MKTKLIIAVSYKEVTTKEFIIDLPENDKFFMNGNIDASDCQLFAICLYGENTQSGHYNLMRIKGNGFQDTTDFIPRKDMQDSYWVEGQGFRKLALSLIMKTEFCWTEITRELFIENLKIIQTRSLNKLLRLK